MEWLGRQSYTKPTAEWQCDNIGDSPGRERPAQERTPELHLISVRVPRHGVLRARESVIDQVPIMLLIPANACIDGANRIAEDIAIPATVRNRMPMII